MIENKTKKSSLPVLLRVLAVVLVAALLLSLIMPAVSGFLSQTGGDEQSFIDDFDVDISDIDAIEERLDVYYKLKRKYGPEVEDVLRFYEKSKKELEMIEFAREKLDELYQQRKVRMCLSV